MPYDWNNGSYFLDVVEMIFFSVTIKHLVLFFLLILKHETLGFLFGKTRLDPPRLNASRCHKVVIRHVWDFFKIMFVSGLHS